MEKITIKRYVKTPMGDIESYIFTMKVKDLIQIYYVAVRGRDKEKWEIKRYKY